MGLSLLYLRSEAAAYGTSLSSPLRGSDKGLFEIFLGGFPGTFADFDVIESFDQGALSAV